VDLLLSRQVLIQVLIQNGSPDTGAAVLILHAQDVPCRPCLHISIKHNDYPRLSASDSQKRQEGGAAVGVDFMSIRSSGRANIRDFQQNIKSTSHFTLYEKMRIIIVWV
jgi:hypothetical protein